MVFEVVKFDSDDSFNLLMLFFMIFDIMLKNIVFYIFLVNRKNVEIFLTLFLAVIWDVK